MEQVITNLPARISKIKIDAHKSSSGFSMTSTFNNFLSNYIKNKKISRNELIERLYKEREFQQLDHVTLSRWITGKTTPSLYKQVLIAKALKISLLSFIKNTKHQKTNVTNKHEAVLNKFKQSFGITPMLYYSDVTTPLEYRLKNQNYQEHFHVFRAFYNNIEPLKRLAKDLLKLEDQLSYECIVLTNSEKKIIGHFSQIIDIEKINNSSNFISIPNGEIEKSTLAIMGCYANEEQFLGLLVRALAQMSQNHFSQKEYIYIYVVGTMSQELITSLFYGEIIRTYASKKAYSNIIVSLIKINFVKALVNPLLFTKVSENLLCMQECTLDEQQKFHCKVKCESVKRYTAH